jgi:hypothetical protein
VQCGEACRFARVGRALYQFRHDCQGRGKTFAWLHDPCLFHKIYLISYPQWFAWFIWFLISQKNYLLFLTDQEPIRSRWDLSVKFVEIFFHDQAVDGLEVGDSKVEAVGLDSFLSMGKASVRPVGWYQFFSNHFCTWLY